MGIFTSPEGKAREMAEILGSARGIHVEIREDLREVERPLEVREYEDTLRAFLKGEAQPGWETREEAEARIRRSMEDISRAGIDVGVVSHALLLTLFLAYTMEAEPALWLHHSIGFAEYALCDTEPNPSRRVSEKLRRRRILRRSLESPRPFCERLAGTYHEAEAVWAYALWMISRGTPSGSSRKA